MLVVITGASGVGKTTIIKLLLKTDTRLKYSTSLTTRQQRPEEVDGVDYIFVGEEEFLESIAEGKFVEWSEVYGKYYGRLEKDLNELMRTSDALIGIDIQGALKLKKKYPEGIFIFLLPKSEAALEAQLRGRRTDDEASVKRRLEAALQEMKQAGKTALVIHHDLQTVPEYFDYVILLNMRVIDHGPTEQVFTPENLQKTYGGRLTLLEEATETMRRREQSL